MAHIYLFRHAQSIDNKDGIFSGRRDPDLTPQGVEEAKKIRDALKNEKVTKAYTSPLIRCKHTLEIVLAPHEGTELVVADPRIRERDYGDLTGKSKKKTQELYPKEYPLWHRSYDTPPPGGESLKQVEVRVMDFLKELLQNVWQNDVIFICASANSLRPIRRYFEKMTEVQMTSFEHEPGKIYTYEV
ncbi:MAG: histidine phosphatase family protein [Candidatus Levybacteria bacterium]|nr:histidine phosphatase family protein [Candidatus Levybacteria bacterium]